MTTYRSKIGVSLLIPILLVVGGTGLLMVYQEAWFGVAIILLVITFIIHLFVTTYYQVDGSTLKIRCGFLYNRSINIHSIKEIKNTSSVLSAAATSLDRIVITYNRYDSVIISPKDKKGFIDHLVKINPGIKAILVRAGEWEHGKH